MMAPLGFYLVVFLSFDCFNMLSKALRPNAAIVTLLRPTYRMSHLPRTWSQSRGFGSFRKATDGPKNHRYGSSRESLVFEFWHASPGGVITSPDIVALMKTISDLEGWIELDAGCPGRHNTLRSLTRGSGVRCGRRCCNEGDAVSCCGKCGCRIMEPGEARRCRTALQKNCGDVAHRCCGGCCGESCTSELDPDCEADDRSRGLEEDLANGIDSDGRPALVRAALWRRPDLVRDLLDQGADPTEPSSGVGDTAIRVAVEGDNEDVLGEIINHVGPSDRDIEFHTIERKRIALKELMSVEDRAGRRVSDYPDALAIQMAICRAYEYMLNICEFVVDDVPRPDLMGPENPRVLPVHVDAVDWSGETALFSAVRRGHLRKAEFLLDHGAAVDKEVWGRTALHEAVRVGAVDVMKLLLKYGADPNLIAEVDGLSCLHVAMTRGGNSDVIRSLLDHGADPAVRSEKVCNFTIDGVDRGLASGSTAMHFAMQLERRDLAALVLDCLGPRPSDVDSTVRDEKSRRCECLMGTRNDAGLLASFAK